jgi:DNA-binding LytR/AlgR family response regulator
MRLALCEDEEVFQDVILDYLNPYIMEDRNISIDVFSSGMELLDKYARGERYDIVFLDVEMPGMLGVDVARSIRDIDISAILIFMTAYTQYVKDAFCINAFQCLLKPIKRDVFNEEFERAVNCLNKMKCKYSITNKDKRTIFEIKDIVCIEIHHRHLRLSTVDSSYEYTGSLGSEEKKLSNYGFIRCHQGYLVNMRYIFQVKSDCFVLSTQKRIPISRRLKNDALSKYHRFLMGYCL